MQFLLLSYNGWFGNTLGNKKHHLLEAWWWTVPNCNHFLWKNSAKFVTISCERILRFDVSSLINLSNICKTNAEHLRGKGRSVMISISMVLLLYLMQTWRYGENSLERDAWMKRKIGNLAFGEQINFIILCITLFDTNLKE